MSDSKGKLELEWCNWLYDIGIVLRCGERVRDWIDVECCSCNIGGN